MKSIFKQQSFIGCIFCLIISISAFSAQKKYPYQDAAKPVEKRVNDLIKRMSLEEKVAQMSCIWSGKNKILDKDEKFSAKLADEYLPYAIGFIARPSDHFMRGPAGITRGPRETVELVNEIQRFMIKKSRWGIPVLFHEEGLHGCMAKDGTHFPQAIGLASTWNPELLEEVYTIAAREIRARGVHHVLSPVVDVARDPRWGRIEETYGEDPFLVSQMGMAAVRGFQGREMPLAADRVLATLKHMTGHGQPESGINTAPAAVPERMLREVFFPPFEHAVKETGVMSVMASYNEIDGMPSHANRFLLTKVLRGEWGFKGFVVADYNGISDLVSRHRVAADMESAALQALDAGVDVELPDRTAYNELVELVKTGRLKAAMVDRSVKRILRAKFIAGLFENPFADADAAEKVTGNKEARALALNAAHQAIVLLKNEGNALPLEAAKCKKIAVIGPNASEVLLGGYSDVPKHSVSILEGIRKKLGEATAIEFAQGVKITTERNYYTDIIELADAEENRKLIAEAVAKTEGADYAIVVVGGNESTSREAWSDGHLGDRMDITPAGQQAELVQAIAATGVSTVVVLVNGRPLAVGDMIQNVPAVIEAWYPGQEGGTAVADILFGSVNPGGKLPVTIPRSVGQVPFFYNRKPTAGRGYLFGTTEPLFPFGFGLSYTTFTLENLRLGKKEIGRSEHVKVSVDVVNTGARKGDEVVQLYINDVVSSVTRPIKELKAFRRITLEPGKRETVTFTLKPADLAFYNRDMKRIVEPGVFSVMVGPNSVDLQSVELTVK